MPTHHPASDRASTIRSLEIAPTIQEGQIDLEQWEHRLSLRAADRIRENDRFARFVEIVQRAGKDAVGRDA